MYHPNREPLVVLGCGCIGPSWGMIHLFGENKDVQECDNHPEGPEKGGTQRVLRQSTVIERYRFYFLGIPAPKRRSSRPPDWLRTMSEQPKRQASAKPESNWIGNGLF